MADFVGLLKRTIDAQSNATPELRQRIYERARETVEKKLAASNVAPEIVELQRRIVEKAINEVEELCREADESVKLFLEEQEGEAGGLKAGGPAVSGAKPLPAGPNHASAHSRKDFRGEDSFLKRGAPDTRAYAGGGPHFAHEPPETLPDAMFALPENTDLPLSCAGGSADNAALPDNPDLLGDPVPLHDRPDFVDSAFPPALEALSVDSVSSAGPVSGDDFSPFGEEKEHTGQALFNISASTAHAGAQGASHGEDVSIGRELLYADEADASFAAFDMSGSFSAAAAQLRHGGDYQPVPDFLLNDEEPGEDASFAVDQKMTGDGGVHASFAGELSADFNVPHQEAAGPAAFMQDIVAAADAGSVQKTLPAARDTAPLPPVMPGPQPVEKQARRAMIPDGITPVGPELEPGAAKPAIRQKTDDFSLVSGIFAQAAMRERKRSGKKRLLAAGLIIIAILCIAAAITWFLTGFLRKEELKAAASGARLSESVIKEERSAKITQRLMPDGQETNPGPAEGQETPGEGTSKTAAFVPAAQTAKAIFHEAQTAILPETTEAGTVRWSLLRDKALNGREEMAIRGDVSIPGKDMMLRMTIRRNDDPSIPAAYLIEMIFVVPENFDGGAVDRIGQLLFKASEQSAGQELQGTVPFKIDDNFFVLAMNAPKPFLNRNLNLMRQLPWIKLNIAYKNGRIGEFSFAKGDAGDAIFKQVLDNAAEDEDAGKAALSGGENGAAQP